MPDRDEQLLRRSAAAIRAQGDDRSADELDEAADHGDEAAVSREREGPQTVARRARRAAANAHGHENEAPPPSS